MNTSFNTALFVTPKTKSQLESLALHTQSLMGDLFKYESNKIGRYRELAAQLAGFKNYSSFLSQLSPENEINLHEKIEYPTINQFINYLEKMIEYGYNGDAILSNWSDGNHEHSMMPYDIEITESAIFICTQNVLPVRNKEETDFIPHAYLYPVNADKKDALTSAKELLELLSDIPKSRRNENVFLKGKIAPFSLEDDWDTLEENDFIVKKSVLSYIHSLKESYEIIEMFRDGKSNDDCTWSSPNFYCLNPDFKEKNILSFSEILK